MKLSEYILRPREVRIAHIDCSTPCDLQGERAKRDKQSILGFLGLENDVPDWKEAGIHRCHLCKCDSQNGWCANRLHYYIGTSSENTKDFLTANPEHPRKNGACPYRDPETGGVTITTPEEASSLGLVGVTSGQTTYRNPESGETRMLSAEKAEALGWVGVTAGKSMYRNPETGETQLISREEAAELGWSHIYGGNGVYRNPSTGDVKRMPRKEAEERGWASVNAGKGHEVVTCPHCGEAGGKGNMKRYHFDNCIEHEGSWRWFKAQMKEISTTLVTN